MIEYLYQKDKKPEYFAGDSLTIKDDIISWGGALLFKKGDIVTIESVNKIEGKWSRVCPDIWIQPIIYGFILTDEYGEWLPTCFVETSDEKDENKVGS